VEKEDKNPTDEATHADDGENVCDEEHASVGLTSDGMDWVFLSCSANWEQNDNACTYGEFAGVNIAAEKGLTGAGWNPTDVNQAAKDVN